MFSLEGLAISHHLRKTSADPDPRFTVRFAHCPACGLLQITEAIPPELIYGDSDTYTTGFQRPRHLEDLIATAIARRDPGSVIDIGCNDGSLMDALQRAGYRLVVGLEPNPSAARVAREKGHSVHAGYLTAASAAAIVAEHGRFDAVYLRHVVEHISDLEGFFAAIRALLRMDGLLVLELPAMEEAMALGSPAILWEEHISYFTRPLAEYMLARFGFAITDRRHYAFGGGSLAFVARMSARPLPDAVEPPDPAAAWVLLQDFVVGMERQRTEMGALLSEARSNSYRVLIYGVAPRSCLVVAACRIGGLLDFAVDDRHDLHHRLMPGTPNRISALTEVADQAGGKLLCLLGVGSENEFKVRARVEAALGCQPVFVSLFPPRDTLASIGEARRAIAAARE